MTPRKPATTRRRSTPKDSAAKAAFFTPAGITWNYVPAGTKFNYTAEVGNGLGSSVLVALLCWLMRTFPEAPAVVEKRLEEQWRPQFGHEMAKLIANPNPYYTGRELWMATVLDFAFGNAYWLKVRNGLDEVVELWWVPNYLMRPIHGPQWPGVFIHHYEYTVNGITERIDPRDVVHFRFGLHPQDTRSGYTPLASLVREIYVDDQASNFTASILRNLGVMGVVVSPKAGSNIPADKMTQTKEYVQQNFTGDKRGQGMVFSSPTDVQVLSYNLQGFDVGPIRDIAEERCSAALGIPAAVVGFGTGLQQTKVGATMRELIQQAWNGCIMPMQAILAEKLDHSLLAEFQNNTGHSGLFRTQFDTSNVRALREDEKDQADRLTGLVAGGVITLAEARGELGFDVKPEHKVYYRPTNVEAVLKPTDPPQASTVRVTQQEAPNPDGAVDGSAPDKPASDNAPKQ
jgi:phage portal protein BeeE